MKTEVNVVKKWKTNLLSSNTSERVLYVTLEAPDANYATKWDEPIQFQRV